MRRKVLVSMLGMALLIGATQPADLQADSRLDQKLTLREAGTPLSRLFQQIEKQTSVALHADKELAQRRAILYAPERNLREVMTSLATAFEAEWQADESRPPRYTLRPLPLQRATNQRVQNLRERLRSLYQPDELALPDEIDETARVHFLSAESQRRAPLRFLERLTEIELNALRAGKTLEFSSRADPRFDPQWLTQWKARLHDEISYLAEALSTPKGDMELAEYYGGVLGKAFDVSDEIRLRLSFDPATGELACALGLFHNGALVYGETHTSDESKSTPEGYEDESGNARMPPKHPWAAVVFPDDLQESVDEAGNPIRRPLRAGESLARPPDAPPLDGDWFARNALWILQVAEASGKPFAAEFYWKPDFSPSFYSIASFVRDLAVAGYEWLSADDWVIMRHRDRAAARQGDVPPDALARWFFKPHRRGVLTVHDLAEMGDHAQAGLGYALFEYLAQYGMAHGLVYNGELPAPYILQNQLLGLPQLHHGLLYALASIKPFYERPEAFDAWVALSASQRRALANGQPIPLTALSPKARRAVYALWGLGDPARTPAFWSDAAPQGSLSLQSRDEPIYLFRLPSTKARNAKDIETALRIWDELDKAVGYEHEKTVEQGLLREVCCVRSWRLRVVLGEQPREYLLFHDYSLLIQRGELPPTPR